MVPAAWRHAGMARVHYEDAPSGSGSLQSAPELRLLSEIPCRVSSDLHEWRNDLGAVSTMGSVKLQSRLRCRVPAARRKDPVNLYYNLILESGTSCSG